MTDHRIVTRAEWGSRQIPPGNRHPITLPAPRLWLHHTVTGAPHDAASVRSIQRYHIDTRGWTDIAYSWIVAPTGVVYECRGWGISGGHTAGDNSSSHAICAMGNYETDRPTDALLDSIAWLTADGHRRGYGPASITGGHRSAPGASTACPGRHLVAALPDLARRTATYLADAPPPSPPNPPTPPKDFIAMATEAQLRQIIREEVGKAIGWTRAIAENPTWPQDSQRLADRAGHLNPHKR